MTGYKRMKRIVSVITVISVLCLTLGSCKSSHNHEYANKWSFDENNHWRAAICEHTGEVNELAAHTDADKNGKCDVCKYAMPASDGGNGNESDGGSENGGGELDNNWDTNM